MATLGEAVGGYGYQGLQAQQAAAYGGWQQAFGTVQTSHTHALNTIYTPPHTQQVNRCRNFMRVNERCTFYEGQTHDKSHPLDELRLSVSEWLGKA